MTTKVAEIMDLVRQKLRADGIKLWLVPYHNEGFHNTDEIEHLAHRYSDCLAISFEHCRNALNELQAHALEKLEANQQFAQHGIATLKVRVPVNNAAHGGSRHLSICTALTVSGRELQQLIADRLETQCCQMRLINKGAFVREQETLQAQGIGNHHALMVVRMKAPTVAAPSTDEEAGAVGGEAASSTPAAEEDIYARIARTRQDAELLSARGNQFVAMEDQAGNAVHLPPAERSAVMVALALHEIGRAQLRREEYSEALVWLLEADDEFKQCRSELLQSVDNWALLNLDIVWCYLCLKSVAQLPEADTRLQVAQRHFQKTYGDQLNRVISLKGTAAAEGALILRLHIMQAVILYHQQRPLEAATLFLRADTELGRLRVHQPTLDSMIEMGYSAREARLALRCCDNRIDEAITHIAAKRSERLRADRLNRAEERSAGPSSSRDKRWVNPRSLHSLVAMGFSRRLATVALRLADNELPAAIERLRNDAAALERQYREDYVLDKRGYEQLRVMGFAADVARLALQECDNGVAEAVALLERCQVQLDRDGGVVRSSGAEAEPTVVERLCEMLVRGDAGQAAEAGEAAEAAATAEPRDAETRKAEVAEKLAQLAAKEAAREAQAMVERTAAFDRLAGGLETIADGGADDHLDISLEEEAKVLAEYKRYLNL